MSDLLGADGLPLRMADGLSNVFSGQGTKRDKATGNIYGVRTLSDFEIQAAYRSSWVVRKAVDIPALDACRKWRDWSGDAD